MQSNRKLEAIPVALCILFSIFSASAVASPIAEGTENSVHKEATTAAPESSTIVQAATVALGGTPANPTSSTEPVKPCTCPPSTPKTEEPHTEEPKAAEFQHTGPVISKTGFVYAFSGFLGIGIIFYGVKAYCARKRLEDRQI